MSFLEIQGLVRSVSGATEEVARTINPEGSESAAAAAAPSITDAILAAPALAAQLLIFIGTLFFFVLAQDDVYRWIVWALQGADSTVDARLADAIRLVSRYFLTVAVINLGFGAFVGIGLRYIGMPSPIPWTVVATLINFILYLGPAMVAGAFLIAGIVVYEGFQLFLQPLIFVGLNLIEGQFVTPVLVGRHIAVNPLLVFQSLVFWLWLWGPIGGIVAIPVVIWCLALSGKLGSVAVQTDRPAEMARN